MEKLEFRLKHRLQSYLGVYGGLDPQLSEIVQEAQEAIQKELPEAGAKTNQALLALKERFV